jgi:MFS family permease
MKFPIDPSKNSLLSSDLNKKTTDKKTNEFKKSNNKRKIKTFENDSIFEAYEEETSKKKKANEKEKDKKKSDRIIVDNIENIYSCLANRDTKKNSIQRVFLLMIPFFTSLCHWIFLFLTKSKVESNYCFSDLNQFDSCLSDQICENFESKINLIIYNDTFDVNEHSLTNSKKFIKEMNEINSYYKPLFLSYNYEISQNKLLSNVDPIKNKRDKINFAVILTKKEKWNIFLLFSNMCLKETINLTLLVVIIASGAIGSVIFGLLADIYGRKKIIIVLLSLICFGFSFLLAITFFILGQDFTEELNKIPIVPSIGSILNNKDILYQIKEQMYVAGFFEYMIPLYLVSLIIICLALRPLNKISLALLLENSINDLNVLQNFRTYSFVTSSVPQFFAFVLLVVTNNFFVFLIVFDTFFIVLLIVSIIFINESIRYHYEYCEWGDLTNEVNSLFKLTDELPINYKNIIQYEAFRFDENRQMYGTYIKRINSIFEYVKQRITYLKRDIKRNSSFIIKKEEVKFNPLIIYTSLSANRVFNRLKYLLIIILFIINIQLFFVEREIVELPFMNISDLYFDIHNNFIINSNYFILIIIGFISNMFYYMCYRISCFKLVFYPSLVILTILLITYHYVSGSSKEIPIILNNTNFNMLNYKGKKNLPSNINSILFLIYFFLIGVNFYMNIIVTKITKTLYRCSLFGINCFLELLSFAFGETLKYQINNCFLLIAGLNSIGIVSELYLGELKGIPNIINDLKQNINIEDNKVKEKSKKV